jgi:peptidoglycan/LPS O-acetylase OafA/YrhL
LAERLEKSSESKEIPLGSRPDETHKTPDPRSHSVELDALRGIGILGIVATHAIARWDNAIGNPLSVPLSNISLLSFFSVLLGPFCLALFFLLSGYLLSGTEGRRASKGNYTLRSYALRRALRLVPAYYVGLAVSFLLWPRETTLTDTLLHLSVLQSFWPGSPDTGFDPAYWYLTSEVVFYALLPILVLKIRGLYPRLALFGALLALCVMLDVYAYLNHSAIGGYLPYYLYVFPLTHLWVFMAGVLLRMLVDHLKERRPGDSWPKLAFSLFAGSLVFLALLPYVPFLGEQLTSGSFLDITSVVFFAAVPFFVAALLGCPVLSRILSWRVLAFVGVISYSFYLIHDTFIMLIGHNVLRSRWVKSLAAQLDGTALWLAFAGYLGFVLVVVTALAYLSYRYIESPFLRIRPK